MVKSILWGEHFAKYHEGMGLQVRIGSFKIPLLKQEVRMVVGTRILTRQGVF
jgi:hypothetical protein